MADGTLVRDGVCPEHGAVRAVKEVPGPHFPFLVWLVQRATVPLRAFRCPECDAKVRVTGAARSEG
jgi:hypothetical protein